MGAGVWGPVSRGRCLGDTYGHDRGWSRLDRETMAAVFDRKMLLCLCPLKRKRSSEGLIRLGSSRPALVLRAWIKGHGHAYAQPNIVNKMQPTVWIEGVL